VFAYIWLWGRKSGQRRKYRAALELSAPPTVAEREQAIRWLKKVVSEQYNDSLDIPESAGEPLEEMFT
jgi:hypothetical protein